MINRKSFQIKFIISKKFITFFLINRNIIVKYEKLDDSKRAYEYLRNNKNAHNVEYIPTKHNSDELYNFQYLKTETYDQDAKDATITLNMFKIKKNDNNSV